MAVPKKKKSASAGKRQEQQWRLVQRKKIMQMVDREKRNEKGRDLIDAEVSVINKENITVVAA